MELLYIRVGGKSHAGVNNSGFTFKKFSANFTRADYSSRPLAGVRKFSLVVYNIITWRLKQEKMEWYLYRFLSEMYTAVNSIIQIKDRRKFQPLCSL